MAETAKRKTSKANKTIKGEGLNFDDNPSMISTVPINEEVKETDISFEEAISKLEIIVKDLEAGELTLENSLEKFAEGVSMSKKCLHKLNSAQEKMDKILQEENGEFVLKPFRFQEGGTE